MRGEDSLHRTPAFRPGALAAANRLSPGSYDASGKLTSTGTGCSGDVLIAAGIEPGGETPPLQGNENEYLYGASGDELGWFYPSGVWVAKDISASGRAKEVASGE
jgi:hypothetical protein